MGLIAFGITRCPLCGELLQAGEDYVGMPPFDVPARLKHYGGGRAMHRDCFRMWPDAEAFRAAFKRAARRWPGGPQEMTADGDTVAARGDTPPRSGNT